MTDPAAQSAAEPAPEKLEVRTPRRGGGARGSIRTKILVMVLLPSLVLLVVGVGTATYFVVDGLRVQRFAEDARAINPAVSRLINALQRERMAAIEYLSRGNADHQDLDEAVQETDAALSLIEVALQPMLDSATEEQRALLAEPGVLAEIGKLRQAVLARQLTVIQADGAYDQAMAQTAVSITTFASEAPSASVATAQLFGLSMFQAATSMWRSSASGLALIRNPELVGQLGPQFTSNVAAYHVQVAQVVPQLAEDSQARFLVLSDSPDWRALTKMENALAGAVATASTTGRVPNDLGVSAAEWLEATNAISLGMADVFVQQSDYSETLASDLGRDALIRYAFGGAALVLVTLLTIAVALRMSRRLIGRLRRLRAETLDLAQRRLPVLMSHLAEGQPVDLATQVPLMNHGSDEIGQVATAFNTAQHAALEAAVREAQTREGIRSVFLSIAHRSQIIIHRQLEVLVDIQRSLDDPDQMQSLFELDHLATRARRNAENLIILGGQQPGRQWRRPVALLDIARSAVGEGESYTRVVMTPIPQVWIEGNAVADVIHLLAELLDNATAFSPPQSRVEIKGSVAGRGVVVEVEDRGLGIEPEARDRLNATLADPPDFDILALSDESQLGIFVVARLAARHGITVTLDASPYGGTRAIVLLPSTVITDSTTPGVGDTGRADLPAAPETFPTGLGPSSSGSVRTAPSSRPALTSRATSPSPMGTGPEGNGAETNGVPRSESPYVASPRSPAEATPDPATTPIRGLIMPTGRWTPATPSAQAPPPPPAAPTSSRQASNDLFSPPPPPPPPPGSSHRPPLPHRRRQAHLAAQLREEPVPDGSDGLAEPGQDQAAESLDRVRDRISAFQRGTEQARASDNPAPGAGGKE